MQVRKPRQWSREHLDALALHGDPEADQIVRRYHESTGAHPAALVRHLVEHRRAHDSAECSEINAFLTQPVDLPEWADPVQLEIAWKFFRRTSLPMAAALFYSSLPHAYAVPRGAKVLTITGDMQDDPARRIGETGQFLFDVLGANDETPLTLGPGSDGQVAIRYVRLFHAAIRRLCTHGGHDWDTNGPVPINQEDLVGTLLTFTVSAFDAMFRMEITFSAAEAEAYMHTWCVIGHLLGIQDVDGSDLLPITYSQGLGLAIDILQKLEAPSVEGQRLARMLIADGQGHLPNLVKAVPRALVYQLADDSLPLSLGIPPPGRLLRKATAVLQRLSAVTHRKISKSPLSWFVARGSQALLSGLVERNRGHRPPWHFGKYAEADSQVSG